MQVNYSLCNPHSYFELFFGLQSIALASDVIMKSLRTLNILKKQMNLSFILEAIL